MGKTLEENYLKEAEDNRLLRLRLHGTVTTEYHDSIVADAMAIVAVLRKDLKAVEEDNQELVYDCRDYRIANAKLQNENDKLQSKYTKENKK